jgi:hypothetical protein
MDFNRFPTFTAQKTYDRTLFFTGAFRKRGSHFKLVLWQRFTCLQYAATCWAFFKALVTVLPTYRTMAQEIECLLRF